VQKEQKKIQQKRSEDGYAQLLGMVGAFEDFVDGDAGHRAHRPEKQK
jgi:hypothetical protein